MQRIFLDGNQLTGSLPELWSSDKALVNLGKLDLSNNRLSGSITWSNANMPYLRNLIVLPGELAVSRKANCMQWLTHCATVVTFWFRAMWFNHNPCLKLSAVILHLIDVFHLHVNQSS